MKLRFLLPSVIFLFLGLVSRAQVTEMLYQGFEVGETEMFSSTPTGSTGYTSSYQMSGSRSLYIQQSSTGDVFMQLSELDFTQLPGSRYYISLEFDHIADVNSNGATPVCQIQYKRANEDSQNWHTLTIQNYDRTDGGSSNFSSLSSFARNSYSDWGTNPTNSSWKSERFNMNDVITAQVAPSERRLQIRFVLRQGTAAAAANGKWRLDNIKVKASPDQMIHPTITMAAYPDAFYHPSSRGARIELDATTTIAAGINPDSVYLFYRVGSDPTPVRLPMTPVAGVDNRYRGNIPFFGYDTTMAFYCVVRDATTNANMYTFPSVANSWIEYACVRGVEQNGVATPEFTGTTSSSVLPFPGDADHRCEWVFDSALLAAAGYGPGQMTAMRFTLSAHSNTVTRPRLQMRMKNVETNYVVDESTSAYYPFTLGYMKVVYDGPMTVNEGNANAEQTLQFQDTFYYAGKDIVMQVTYDAEVDLTPTAIKFIPSHPQKKSIYTRNIGANFGYHFPFNDQSMIIAQDIQASRPALVLTQKANLPLLYDMGVSELVTPSYETAMTPNDHSVKVKLKNFGALTANAIQISYSIDDTINGSYNWTGSLAAGNEQTVTVASNVPLNAGFHTICVWVEDSLTASGVRYRDHEPYNDSVCSEFIVCAGPMSGVRNIGGANADFNTMEEFLFALSRCGINDSLVVKLAPGYYQPFKVPAFDGGSAQHYVVFEPASGNVTFYSADTAESIADVSEASYVYFRNLNFVRRSAPLTNMVLLGLNSTGCHIEQCSFIDSVSNPAANMRIGAMINTGYANNTTIDGCTFRGGKKGVDVKGQAPDILSLGNIVRNCYFENQYEYAVDASNQSNLLIDKNEMYDVLSLTMGVLQLNACSGQTRVTANKIYSSHGSGAIALNNVSGTLAQRLVVANNMIVSQDNGNASQMRPPLNVISANYTDVVYNSVKMIATQRNNISAATFGSGGTMLQNCRFLNNIVVTLDDRNYALNYNPGTSTSNIVGHNVYYTLGSTLNRRAGASATDMASWVLMEPADTNSVSVNPNFLNGSRVDLRTFNRLVKGVGIPLSNVTNDMFDSLRGATSTCPGAFEFSSLQFDFEPEALVSPVSETCHMPASVQLAVRLRNSGTSAYTGTGLSLGYKVGNGGAQTVPITATVPAEDTVTIPTGVSLSLPAGTNADITYTIKVWTIFASDPNQTNDTNTFQVVSKYHPSRPNDDSVQIQYATAATITPTSGVDTWQLYYSGASAPMVLSELQWYRDTNDAAPFFVGNTLTTDTIRTDTTFFFRQRRAKPVVRITQVEFARGNNTVGLTPSMPYWISSNRKVALQLTNRGDARANLFGDTIQTISPTSNLNNKIFVFTDSVFIEPGQSLVVQFATGSSANPAMTIHTGTPLSGVTINAAAKVAFVYRHGGKIVDAVAMNNINDTPASGQTVTWANSNVPNYVWSGSGVNIPTGSTTAGLIRTGFGNNASSWTLATNANPMFLNTINDEWILFTDNGCEGYFAKYKVKLEAPPTVDVALSAPALPASSCGMGMENITVQINNYGIQAINSLTLHYCAGGDTVTEVLQQPIASTGRHIFTFSTPLNLAFDHDSLVTVRVWADSLSGDPTNLNDTSSATVMALYTPAAPSTTDFPSRQVDYATRDTISFNPGNGLIPVWYDYDGNAVDTSYLSVSEILYFDGNRGVSYIVTHPEEGTVGTGTTMNNATAFPSPYQPKSKHAKQQYIYSASDLRAAGLQAGYINSIAFNLKAFGNNVSSFTYNEYTISLGLTSDTIFANNSDWKNASQVYTRSSLAFTQSDLDSWVSHQLDTPFYWDGVSSVVVQITHYIASNASGGARSTYTAKTSTTLTKDGSSALSPSTAEYVGTGTKGNNRPNIRFGITTYGCASPVTNYHIQMVNQPQVDMAIMWPDGVDTLEYNSCGTTPVYVDLRNQGATAVSNAKLYYYYDTLAVDSTTVTSTVTSGQLLNQLLFNRHMTPGRHTVKVIVAAPGDSIHSNDTIVRSFMVRFCSAAYTIAPVGGDYRSFGEAIDTLNIVGIEGPVTFNVAPGTYTEQVVLNNIPGASATNTIKFIGTGNDVLLTAATSQANNYVMLLDSASHVTLSNFRIEARPTVNGTAGNYANALVLSKGGNITIDSLTVKVKGSIDNANASCVVLMGEVSNLVFRNNVMDSGYYSFRHSGAVSNYLNFTLNNNTFRNFRSQGVNLRGVTNLQFDGNVISSSYSSNGRALTGLYLAQSAGNLSIQKNKINLIDNYTGGKRGIVLINNSCTASDPGMVVNNMVSCSGTGNASQKPAGIYIDSTASYLNVYFNTVRVSHGTTNAAYSENSYAYYSGPTVSHIQVMNNIFSNFSKGYSYYVAELQTVSISNYNAYFTESSRPFFWKQIKATLAELQTANSDDALSLVAEPYFVADNDLHLVMTNLAGIAQYNADVPEDIDGTVRKQVPGPTIGAHEMDVVTHDMAVVRITEPTFPISLNFNPPNNMPPNIESDSVRVTAEFYNNGLAPENGVYWYAYIEGHKDVTRTPNRSLGSFAPGESKTDVVMMPTVLGIIDSNDVHVVVMMNSDDDDTTNNNRASTFYLAPAFNLAATGITTDHNGCNMENTIVKLSIKNAGFKDMPAGVQFDMGFVGEITNPTDISVSSWPDTIRESGTLNNQLLMGQTTVIDFPDSYNFYPTGNDIDIKFRLRGWVDYEYDITKTNDSTAKNSTAINSYFSPVPPVPYDTTLPYGTWGALRASQENSLPIRWYRDTTASFFFPGSNQVTVNTANYNRSTLWNNTPQYFADSTYWLNCYSAKGCHSRFVPIHVYMADLRQNDMAFEAVLAPLGERVYMLDDTVRLRIANYGTRPQSNVPVAYQLKRGNVVLQEVFETCRTTIPAGQTHIYTFDSLLTIPTPTSQQNYTLTVWTDLTTDETRRNDTIRYPYTFRSLAESTYNPQKPGNPSFDITRVSFNEFDFECPQLGRGLTDLAATNTWPNPTPDYPVVHVTRGLADSLIVQVTPLDGTAQRERVKIWVAIDFDRNGIFSPNETMVDGDIFYNDNTYSNFISISEGASYGYMRMRIAVGNYSDFSGTTALNNGGIPSDKDGHNIDVLLYVDPDPPTTDLAITQIVSPRSYLVRDDQPLTVSFRIANKGTANISDPVFHYRFLGSVMDTNSSGTVTYNGTLRAGSSAVVSLPAHVFPLGVTDLTIWHELPDDPIRSNNTLEYQYNRFHIVRPILNDDFEGENKWYAPKGYNLYSQNFWERGIPNKSLINAAYSDSTAWVTDLNNTITTGTRGNVSYLYSPIINISQIKADTLSFRLRRNLTNGSSLRLEFCNFENKWVSVNADSLTNWYNNADDECFDGNTAGADYNYYWLPTNLISGDFPELLQFRFVYTTPMKTSASASFGEGCAVDNFHVGRARRPIDVGVVAIPYPDAPAYGQTIYPKVVVYNYGTDTVRRLDIGYIHYGTFLPKESSLECLLAPQTRDTFEFTTPFIVEARFPDTFQITAFTQLTASDLYRDNDTCTASFSLSPLENDISAHSFVYPLENVVAGDSLQVTLRMRNFGSNPISEARVSYIVNGNQRVDEDVVFEDILGRPLNSMEYFNYTFRTRFRMPMGVVNMVGITKSSQNDYVFNDTVSKRIEGINSVMDLAAASIIVDSSAHTVVRISLVIDNRGARGANGFEVGYYIDDDTSADHVCREIYSRDMPLPALTTGYHTFSRTLPPRSAPYSNVTGFIHVLGDNDQSNDTTRRIATQYLDVELLQLIVIENAQPDCKVIGVLRNNGNVSLLSGTMYIDGTINGQPFSDAFQHRIEAGQTIYHVFERNIPKSPNRTYVGSAVLDYVNDADPSNNQTNIIEVRGYWQDAPVVETTQLVLDQNYPNPFTDRTTIPFSLPNDADVRFFVVDAMGHIVNSFTQHYGAGAQTITLDMSAYASGIYYYGIEVDGKRLMKKMIMR